MQVRVYIICYNSFFSGFQNPSIYRLLSYFLTLASILCDVILDICRRERWRKKQRVNWQYRMESGLAKNVRYTVFFCNFVVYFGFSFVCLFCFAFHENDCYFVCVLCSGIIFLLLLSSHNRDTVIDTWKLLQFTRVWENVWWTETEKKYASFINEYVIWRLWVIFFY